MSGIVVVVKKVDLWKVKWDFYLLEFEVFDKVLYIKLVLFFGMFFDCEEEKYLVYKYCLNIDLVFFLYKKGVLGVYCEDVL